MPSYVEEPLPQIGEQHPWRRYAKITQRDIDQALRYRGDFREQAYEKDGALLWKSNDRCVPKDIFRDAFCIPEQSHLDTERAQADAFFAEYRERMKNHVYSDEELFEMRAAFGEDATVVNVITGKRTKL